MTESAGPHAPKNTAPRPLALCLEDLSPHAGPYRFMQCVAVPGRVPGLRIDREGAIRWLGDQDVAIELWVSADGRLVLYRTTQAVTVHVRRARRSFDVPVASPAFIVDGDEVQVATWAYRVHVHGATDNVVGLRPAAEISTNTSGTPSGAQDPLEFRPNPPSVPVPEKTRPVTPVAVPDGAGEDDLPLPAWKRWFRRLRR